MTHLNVPAEKHLITREIGIDMGHRVTHHGSKCRNLHGHRYTIQATCAGPLFTEGEQQGMVLDFGFLKDEMMNVIDARCDHGMCLWMEDPFVQVLLDEGVAADARTIIAEQGFMLFNASHEEHNTGGKYYIVPFVPTAENLARHWFQQLAHRVKARTNDQAELVNVKVWETPNCTAEYPGLGV